MREPIQDFYVPLLQSAASLDDPRINRQKKHELVDIVAIALCSVIAGADTFTAMQEFAEDRIEWLRRFLSLPGGVPSHDTFRRVFSLIDPLAFQECFMRWTREIAQIFGDKRLIALDGKRLKGASKDRTQGPLTLVSAWAADANVILGQVKTDRKSNELTALPELIELLDLRGALVTADALHCQKTTAQAIVRKGGDYVLAVKRNQKKLLGAIQNAFHDTSIPESCFDYLLHQERAHGREEVREYFIGFANAADAVNIAAEGWSELKMIAMVVSTRTIDGKKSEETRYFISSLDPEENSLETFAQAIRRHWEIENSLHWTLDVAFGEDLCQVREKNAAANLGVVRRVALSLLKQDKSARVGVATRRLKAAWNPAYIEKTLAAAQNLSA